MTREHHALNKPEGIVSIIWCELHTQHILQLSYSRTWLVWWMLMLSSLHETRVYLRLSLLTGEILLWASTAHSDWGKQFRKLRILKTVLINQRTKEVKSIPETLKAQKTVTSWGKILYCYLISERYEIFTKKSLNSVKKLQLGSPFVALFIRYRMWKGELAFTVSI